MFKQPLDQGSDREEGLEASGALEIVDAGPGDFPEVPPDGLTIARSNGRLAICSELMTAILDQGEGAWRARVAVRERGRSDLFYRVHLSVVLHRMLLALGRAYLHAAAVTLGGRTFVFVGEKGAGKSSIATTLGRAGATILSDDHVLLRRGASGYFVSGCEARARVTAETEAAVFDTPLAIPAEDFAGTLKKEFLVRDFFASRPREDAPVGGVLFPRVGLDLRLTPRNPRHTALDLIQRTRPSFRPQDADDVRALLDFWAGLAQTAPAWDLELSPDVSDLARLGAVLESGIPG
jgi:hypothetical protein